MIIKKVEAPHTLWLTYSKRMEGACGDAWKPELRIFKTMSELREHVEGCFDHRGYEYKDFQFVTPGKVFEVKKYPSGEKKPEAAVGEEEVVSIQVSWEQKSRIAPGFAPTSWERKLTSFGVGRLSDALAFMKRLKKESEWYEYRNISICDLVARPRREKVTTGYLLRWEERAIHSDDTWREVVDVFVSRKEQKNHYRSIRAIEKKGQEINDPFVRNLKRVRLFRWKAVAS